MGARTIAPAGEMPAASAASSGKRMMAVVSSDKDVGYGSTNL